MVPTPAAVSTTPEPVDWGLAERVARRIAGREPIATSYLGVSLQRDFEDVTVQAEAAVTELTGLRPPSPAVATVLDRGGWVGANVGSMRRLLVPFSEKVGARMAASPVAPVGRRIAGAELGFLLGYVAQRVLGQYDLLVPEDSSLAISEDAVYYVGPNVLGLEKRFAFRPRDFRLWIAIHEVTHRAQFVGVPWMREYFLSLVQQVFELVDPDPRTLARALSNAVDAIKRGQNPLDEGGLVSLIASPEQRGVLGQVQALMSLLEGHGNVVMTDLGARHVAGDERMARVLHQRRQVGGLVQQVHKFLGLEQKMRQYEVGERFVRGVVDLGGPRAIDHAWVAPENLPQLAELDDPVAWLTRVDRMPAAGR